MSEQIAGAAARAADQAARRLTEIGEALNVRTDDFRQRLDTAIAGVGERLEEAGEEVGERTSLMVDTIGAGADTAAARY